MKVLLVIDGLGTGGAERSLAESLPGLAAAGITPVVAHLYPRQQGVGPGIRRAGFPVHHLAGRGYPAKILQLRRLIAAERPDLVHTVLFDASLVGRVAAATSRTPVLTSLVNVPYSRARRADPGVPLSSLRVAWMADAVAGRLLTTHFHAITRTVRDEAVGALGIRADRVTVVERGRDPVRLGRASPERRRAGRRVLGLEDHHQVVVAVGRQEHQKGHLHLVDAVARMAGNRPDLVLLLAGRAGHRTGAIEERVLRLRLVDRVRLLGHRDDVVDVMAAADVFAFPSLWEGLGGSVIEALALELPVVASDLPALRELLVDGESALLVPPASPVALAAAIGRVLDDPALARRLTAGHRSLFERRFTVERETAEMVALYRRLVPGSGRVAAVPTSSEIATAEDRGREPVRGGGRGRPGRAALETALARSPAQWAMWRRRSSCLAVLAYHGVDDEVAFGRQLDWLAEHTRPVSLDDVADSVGSGTSLPDRAVLLTFDDGRRSLLDSGLPLLRERGIPAVAFVVAGLIGTDRPYWWEEVEALSALGGRARAGGPTGRELVQELKRAPDEERLAALDRLRSTASAPAPPAAQLSRTDLRLLEEGGIAIGNHSLTHPSLPRAADDRIEAEVADAHRVLTDALGHPPRAFAYPNGYADERCVAAVRRRGYELAFVFDHRLASVPPPDPLLISRLRVSSDAGLDRLRTIISGLHPALLRLAGRG